jgi:hypothetical protein
MRDVFVVLGVVAFFALGAAYVVACARILAGTGDIDEALSDDADEQRFAAEEEKVA